MLRRGFAVGLLIAMLAACQPGTPVPPTRPPADDGRNPTAAPAPLWIEAVDPIGRGSVPRLTLLGRLDPPSGASTAFTSALAPDGTRLAALNNDQVIAWDLITGAAVFQTARVNYTRLFYAPDKRELYALDALGQVDILNAETGGVIDGFAGYERFGGVVAYDSENGWLALGGTDGGVRVWDGLERRARVTIEAHTDGVTALAFSRDGARLASAGTDGIVRLWDWATRTQLAEVKNDSIDVTVRIGALAFAPDGAYIAVGTNIDARLWLPDADRMIFLDAGAADGTGGSGEVLTFTPAGDYLLGGNARTGLFLWAATAAITAPTQAEIPLPLRLPGVVGSALSAAFSPDGALLATSVIDSPVALWDMTRITDQTVARADVPTATTRFASLAWTPDARLLLLFDAGGSVFAWGLPPPENATPTTE